jgi:hypothetical protein
MKISDSVAAKIREHYADGTPLSAELQRYKEALELAYAHLIREKSIEKTARKMMRMTDPSTGKNYSRSTVYHQLNSAQVIFGELNQYDKLFLKNLMIGTHLAKYEEYDRRARKAETDQYDENGDISEHKNLKWATYFTEKAHFHLGQVRHMASFDEDSPYKDIQPHTYNIVVDGTMKELIKHLGQSPGVVTLESLANFRLPETIEVEATNVDDDN